MNANGLNKKRYYDFYLMLYLYYLKMKYKGIDYTNKTAIENANLLFDSICVELVKSNKVLFDKVKQLLIIK